MLNYPHNDILVTTARVALFLTLVLNYPVLLHPMRGSLNRLLFFLYNSLQECITRRQWAESQPLLPKSKSTEFKVYLMMCCPLSSPSTSSHPFSLPPPDSHWYCNLQNQGCYPFSLLLDSHPGLVL